ATDAASNQATARELIDLVQQASAVAAEGELAGTHVDQLLLRDRVHATRARLVLDRSKRRRAVSLHEPAVIGCETRRNDLLRGGERRLKPGQFCLEVALGRGDPVGE